MTASLRAGRPGQEWYYERTLEAVLRADLASRAASVRDDHYLGAGEPGYWWSPAGTLVADGKAVERGELRQLAQGRALDDGRALTQNAGDPRRTSHWDLTTSAPKAVSLLWSEAGPGSEERRVIEQAVREANQEALRFAWEAGVIATRRGHAGTAAEQPADIAVGSLLQFSSRDRAPQLHVHNVICNVCRRSDGSTGSLDGSRLYKAKTLLGAVFRAGLARRLTERLGVAVERDGRAFNIVGISETLRVAFSGRRAQVLDEADRIRTAIEAQMDADAREVLGQRPGSTRRLRDRATRKTRGGKEFLVGDAALEDAWRVRFAAFGFAQPGSLLAAARTAARARPAEHLPAPGDAAVAEALWSDSAASARTLRRLIAEHAQFVPGGGAALVEAEWARLVATRSIVLIGASADGEAMFSTRTRIEQECSLIAAAVARQAEGGGIVPAAAEASIAARPSLSPEQAMAIRHAAAGHGVTVIEGVAGAGKSYALGAVREAAEASGLRVIGLAPSWDAAAVVGQDAAVPARALQGFVRELEAGVTRLTARDYVMVDEAGLAGIHDMEPLLRHARAAGAKILLIGDRRQIEPVEGGAPLSVIADRIGYARIGAVRRQQVAWQREASQAMADGRTASGLRAYQAHDRLGFHDDRDSAVRALVADWRADLGTHPDETRLVITASNAAVAALNQALRAAARDAGQLTGPDVVVTTIQREAGGKRVPRPLALAVGDHLILGERVTIREGITLNNGDRLHVEAVSADGHAGGPLLRLTARRTGRTLEARLAELTATWRAGAPPALQHGYAVTVHRSQGQTVDRTYVLADGGIDRRLGYVAATRHRHDCRIYVNAGPIAERLREIGVTPNPEAIRDAFYRNADRARAKCNVSAYVPDLHAWLEEDARAARHLAGDRAAPPAVRAAAAAQAAWQDRRPSGELRTADTLRSALRDRVLFRREQALRDESARIAAAMAAGMPRPLRPQWTDRLRARLASLCAPLRRPAIWEALARAHYARADALARQHHERDAARTKERLHTALRASHDPHVGIRAVAWGMAITTRAVFACAGVLAWGVDAAVLIVVSNRALQRSNGWGTGRVERTVYDRVIAAWRAGPEPLRAELRARLCAPAPSHHPPDYGTFRASFLARRLGAPVRSSALPTPQSGLAGPSGPIPVTSEESPYGKADLRPRAAAAAPPTRGLPEREPPVDNRGVAASGERGRRGPGGPGGAWDGGVAGDPHPGWRHGRRSGAGAGDAGALPDRAAVRAAAAAGGDGRLPGKGSPGRCGVDRPTHGDAAQPSRTGLAAARLRGGLLRAGYRAAEALAAIRTFRRLGESVSLAAYADAGARSHGQASGPAGTGRSYAPSAKAGVRPEGGGQRQTDGLAERRYADHALQPPAEATTVGRIILDHGEDAGKDGRRTALAAGLHAADQTHFCGRDMTVGAYRALLGIERDRLAAVGVRLLGGVADSAAHQHLEQRVQQVRTGATEASSEGVKQESRWAGRQRNRAAPPPVRNPVR